MCPRVAVIATLFPSAQRPVAGLFIRERLFRVAGRMPLCEHALFAWGRSDADKLLFDQFEEDWVADPELGAQAQSNDLANFGFGFDKKFEATIIGRMDINDDIFRRLMDDATFAEAVRSYYRQQVYERLREGQDV